MLFSWLVTGGCFTLLLREEGPLVFFGGWGFGLMLAATGHENVIGNILLYSATSTHGT